ncbi:hypothetical protein BKA70DRAFT_1506064 [Coprinopsis sp. MPI-PUGE-AT-0042]|nr:hypothetical protein BKA70DRAFT_1506064 [Coprinopsis sp. MPI-PUGE-AT-0042]
MRGGAPSAATLYDVRGSTSQAWAPNVWRIRFILNYKRVPYRTVWLEINEVEAAMHRIGAPASGVRPDGSLNTPARPVFPEGSRAVQSLFVHYVQEVFSKPLLALMVPLSHQHLPGHPPPPHGTHALSGPQQELAWKAVKEQFDFLAAILDKNVGDQRGDGVVVMGRDLSYADFALCSVLVWIERVAGRETWRMVREWNGGRWRRLWERCREWMDEQ